MYLLLAGSMITSMLDNGIKPYATIFHWDLPQVILLASLHHTFCHITILSFVMHRCNLVITPSQLLMVTCHTCDLWCDLYCVV